MATLLGSWWTGYIWHQNRIIIEHLRIRCGETRALKIYINEIKERILFHYHGLQSKCLRTFLLTHVTFNPWPFVSLKYQLQFYFTRIAFFSLHFSQWINYVLWKLFAHQTEEKKTHHPNDVILTQSHAMSRPKSQYKWAKCWLPTLTTNSHSPTNSNHRRQSHSNRRPPNRMHTNSGHTLHRRTLDVCVPISCAFDSSLRG